MLAGITVSGIVTGLVSLLFVVSLGFGPAQALLGYIVGGMCGVMFSAAFVACEGCLQSG